MAQPVAVVAADIPRKGFGTAEIVVIGLIVLAVAAGGYVLVNQGNGDRAGVSAAEAPPAGTIWFGQSYDPSTFALTGRSMSVPAARQVALVASLSRPTRAEYLSVNLSDSTGTLPIGGGQMAAGNDLMAYLIPSSLVFTGTYQVTVTDSGGNLLASGTLTVQ